MPDRRFRSIAATLTVCAFAGLSTAQTTDPEVPPGFVFFGQQGVAGYQDFDSAIVTSTLEGGSTVEGYVLEGEDGYTATLTPSLTADIRGRLSGAVDVLIEDGDPSTDDAYEFTVAVKGRARYSEHTLITVVSKPAGEEGDEGESSEEGSKGSDEPTEPDHIRTTYYNNHFVLRGSNANTVRPEPRPGPGNDDDEKLPPDNRPPGTDSPDTEPPETGRASLQLRGRERFSETNLPDDAVYEGGFHTRMRLVDPEGRIFTGEALVDSIGKVHARFLTSEDSISEGSGAAGMVRGDAQVDTAFRDALLPGGRTILLASLPDGAPESSGKGEASDTDETTPEGRFFMNQRNKGHIARASGVIVPPADDDSTIAPLPPIEWERIPLRAMFRTPAAITTFNVVMPPEGEPVERGSKPSSLRGGKKAK